MKIKNMAYWKSKNSVPKKDKTGFPSETETEEGNVSAYIKKNQQYVDKDKTIPLSPGFEDTEKIQRVQELGITPHSQKFGKKDAPTKHKMKARKGGHGIGGMGYMPPVTAEDVKAHDDKYGEGHTHDSSKYPSKKGKGWAKLLGNLSKKKLAELEKKKKKK